MKDNSFNENNNNINNEDNINKESIISLLEKLKLERDNALNNYTNLKLDYDNIKKELEESKIKISALEAEIIKANSKVSYSEQKLKENINNFFSNEKKLSSMTGQNELLQKKNLHLEEQLSHYKNIFYDFKSRSEKEMNILMNDLEEIQKEKEELQQLNLKNQSELNKWEFKNKLITIENETLKYDNDHLIKILEETNQVVKTSEAKTLSFDNNVNEYKKQINELNLEIDKLNLEIKLQKEHNNKFKEFFLEKISISEQNFENGLIEIRNSLHKKVEDKITEYNILKGNFFNMKIERDKYLGEYTILNQDYNKNKEIFQKQYLDIEKEKKEKEIEMNRNLGYLNDKLKALHDENKNLKIKNAKLESNNKDLEQEKNVRDKLEMKNREISEEIKKITQEKEDLERENAELKNKIDNLLSDK